MNVRSTCLTLPANAFFANVSRTDSLSWFPAVVAGEALQKQLWRDYAIVKVTGKLTIRKTPFSNQTERAIAGEILKLEAKRMARFMAGEDDRRKRWLTLGMGHLNDLLERTEGANQSVRAIMFSVVIESWMAFEVLAGDLFFAALDNGFPKWRINVHERRSEFTKGSDWMPKGAIRHDPQANYGSALKDGNDVPLDNIKSIKSWYKTAFGSKAANLFKDQKSHILALAFTRNAIVHNAGNADDRYLSEMRKVAREIPEFRKLIRGVTKGKPIRLNGQIVRTLRNAAIIVGTELLLYLDKEIIRSKRKP